MDLQHYCVLLMWIVTIDCSTVRPPPAYLDGISHQDKEIPSSEPNIIVTKRQVNPLPQPRPVTTKPSGRTVCEEGNIYKFLTICKKECGGTVSDEDNDHKTWLRNRDKTVSVYSYKLVILGKSEFNLHRNGSLLTELPERFNFPEKYFVVKDQKAYLCFPMPESFLNCDKWILNPDEFKFKNESRFLWVPIHDKHYKAAEYAHRKRHNEIDVCRAPESNKKKIRDKALLTAWIISAICLGVLIVLSQIFPILNMKNNKILLCNLSVLFVAYWTLSIKHLLPSLNRGVCAFIAYFQQYTFLSAFCWINVQAIDVFLKFISLRVNQEQSKERKKFILYSIHGWITPLLLTIITGMVEALHDGKLNPRLSKYCWFQKKDKELAFLYFFGPISIILGVNTVLFVITVYKLCTIGRGSKNVMKRSVRNDMFMIYFKLIFVMGLWWTMEIVSVGVGGDDQHWNVTDMINALQGVFIFIVYTCKRIFMRRIFDLVCRHPKCPSSWPFKPISMSPNHNEATCSTANSSGGTLSRTSQAVNMDKL